MSNFSEMADRIAFECFQQGRSVNALQRDAKLSPAAIYLLRTKSVHGPTADTVIRICNVLGKDPNWLFGWEEALDQIVDAQPMLLPMPPEPEHPETNYCPNCGAKMDGGADGG